MLHRHITRNLKPFALTRNYTTAAAAEAVVASGSPGPAVAKVTTLDNGLKVATLDLGLPISRVGLFVGNCGTAQDPAKANALRSTFALTNEDKSVFLNRRIPELVGSSLTTTTSREHFSVEAVVGRDDVAPIIDVLASAASQPKLESWEVSEAMGEFKNELSLQRQDLGQSLMDKLHNVSFRGGLSKSIIPAEYRLGKVNGKSMNEFISKYFVPNNCVLVGLDVEHDSFVSEVSQKTANWKGENKPETALSDPFVGGRDARIESGDSSATMLLGFKGASLGSKDALVFSLIQYALCAGPSVRWGGDNSIISKRVAAAMGATPFVLQGGCINYSNSGLFYIEGSCQGAHASTLLTSVSDSIKETSSTGINENVLKRSKAMLKQCLLAQCSTADNILEDMGKQLLQSDSYVPLSEVLKKVDAITTSDVNTILKTLTKPSLVAYGNLETVPYLDELKI